MRKCAFILNAVLILFTSCHHMDATVPEKPDGVLESEISISPSEQSNFTNESSEGSSITQSELPEEQSRLYHMTVSVDDIDQYDHGYYGEEFPPVEEYIHFLERHADIYQSSIIGQAELWCWKGPPMEASNRDEFTLLITCQVEVNGEVVYWGVDRYCGRIYQWELTEQPEYLDESNLIENIQIVDSHLIVLNYIKDTLFADMVSNFGELYLYERDDLCDEYVYRYDSPPKQRGDGFTSYCRLGVSGGDTGYLVRGSIVTYSETDAGAEGTLFWCYVYKNGIVIHEGKEVWILESFE